MIFVGMGVTDDLQIRWLFWISSAQARLIVAGTFYNSFLVTFRVVMISYSHLVYSIDDYEQVLRGCIEILPKMLEVVDYNASKNDIFLVLKFLTDCSTMSLYPYTNQQ